MSSDKKYYPCLKKGSDNFYSSNLCETKDSCKNCGDYLNKNSDGTRSHQKSNESEFIGCHDVEKYLLENKLVRYEMKEEVIVEFGVNDLYFEQEIEEENRIDLDCDYQHYISNLMLEHGDLSDPMTSNYCSSSTSNKISIKENMANHLPSHLGFTRPAIHARMCQAPSSTHESVFNWLYATGGFLNPNISNNDLEKHNFKDIVDEDDLMSVAYILKRGIEVEAEMRVFWRRYTEIRFNKYKDIINEKIKFNTSELLIRLEWIKKKFTHEQMEVFLLEYGGDRTLYNQDLRAEFLGIAVSSYKDRLKYLKKKVKSRYPDLKVINKDLQNTNSDKDQIIIEPLYEVCDGEKTLIPAPEATNKELSVADRNKIKRWTYSAVLPDPEAKYRDTEEEPDEATSTDLLDLLNLE